LIDFESETDQENKKEEIEIEQEKIIVTSASFDLQMFLKQVTSKVQLDAISYANITIEISLPPPELNS
jgi:hypothetical protein